MKRNRNTRIVCTLGPASSSKEVIKQMAIEGMDVARINFSHGNHDAHQTFIDNIRSVNQEGFAIKILQDLEGYRIRTKAIKKPIELKKDAIVTMTHESSKGKNIIPLDLSIDYKLLKPGMLVFIDDGLICLEVKETFKNSVTVKVIAPGLLKSRKGINIPDLPLKANILTEKDKKDIQFGLINRVDFMAQSFIRNKKDIQKVNEEICKRDHRPAVFAKIENYSGLINLDQIMTECAGIMIARGDLGVSLPIYKIPIIQKNIIWRCNKQKKHSITATQMLESMTKQNRPTRAEVSDVANAILDGTDYVMLSGETAVGAHPLECIKMMYQIIVYTEKSIALKAD